MSVALLTVLPAMVTTVPVQGSVHHEKTTFPWVSLRSAHGVDYNVPSVFYGTAWKKERTEELTRDAILRGFRAVDTANQPKHYNETGVGAALATVFSAGAITREQLFIQTKFTPLAGQIDDETLPYDRHASLDEQVAQSIAASFEHLGIDYIDSFVLHEQMADQKDMLIVWRAMEKAYRDNKIHLLGISNINADRLEFLLEHASIKPTFVQNRCQGEKDWDHSVRVICDRNNIRYQGFWLISGNRALLTSKQMLAAAEWHHRKPAQILIKALIEDGMIALTGSTNIDHAAELLQLEFSIAKSEVEAIKVEGRTQQHTESTKVEARFWNSLPYGVDISWRSPAGEETLSFKLAASQTEEDSKNTIANTYHTHEYVFRHSETLQLIGRWVADATFGLQQIVEVNEVIMLTVINQRPERVNLFIKPRQMNPVVLEANDGNPLNSPQHKFEVQNGDILHVEATSSGDVIETFTIDPEFHGKRLEHYLRRHSEHSEEL